MWRYMAPEQAAIMLNRMAENEMVRELDVRADVFALGAILYEMLTRKPLRQSARNYRESLNLAKCNAIDAQALTQAGIPPLIKSICLRALATEPADRVGSAAELATLLVSACRPSVQRRRPMLIASAIALVACLTAAFRLSNNPKYSTSFSATTEARRISPEIQVEVFTKQDDQSIVFREWIGQEIVSARFGQLSRVSVQLPEPRFCYLFGLNPTNNVDEQIQLLYPTNHDLPPELQASFSVPASKTDYLPLIDGVGQQVYLLISSLDSLPAPAVWLADNGKPLTWSQVTQAGAWVYSDGQIQLLLGSDSKERAEPITIVPGQFRDVMDSLRVTLKKPRIHVDGIAFPVQAK